MQATTAACPHCGNFVAIALWAPQVEPEAQEPEPEPAPRRRRKKKSPYNRFIAEQTKGGRMTMGEAAKLWREQRENGR